MIEIIPDAEKAHAKGEALFIEKAAFEHLVANLGLDNATQIDFGCFVTEDDAKVAVYWIREHHPELLCA